jgi:hypothetical protein
VRAQKGDGPTGDFYHDVSRAFFAERADISKREVATGVPAMGWPRQRAIVGMMPAAELVRRLRNESR